MNGGDADPDAPARRFFGRRKGRPLRGRRQALLDTLLPRVSVPAGDEPLDPKSLFPMAIDAVWLEIGFGGGEHLAQQAQARPKTGFIGCEPFVNGVASLLGQIEEQRLENVRVHADDAGPLIARLPDGCFDCLAILFPDPWPKRRHWRRRVIGPATLPAYTRILRPGGEFRIATDHAGYLEWILRAATAQPELDWLAESPGDWRARPDSPHDPWPATRYERKSLAGRPHFLTFRRR